MKKKIRVRLKDPKTWTELLFIFFYCIVADLCLFIVFLIAIFQYLTCFFTGKTNKEVNKFAEVISKYLREIIAYLTFSTNVKPFPFSKVESKS